MEDAGRVLASCLEDLGWTVEVDPATGGVSPVGGVPVEQADRYNSDVASCVQQMAPTSPASTEQLGALYDQLIAVEECLGENGFDTPTRPSKSTFLESGATNWDPYSEIPVGPDQQRAIAACPQPDPYGG